MSQLPERGLWRERHVDGGREVGSEGEWEEEWEEEWEGWMDEGREGHLARRESEGEHQGICILLT